MITLKIIDQPWGTEYQVYCTDCTYFRVWASGRQADNDQFTHEC